MKLSALEEIYRVLLQHPHDAWRARHQWLYCEIRDDIARRTKRSSEEVQTAFEAAASSRP
jgi:hypothetical protein